MKFLLVSTLAAVAVSCDSCTPPPLDPPCPTVTNTVLPAGCTPPGPDGGTCYTLACLSLTQLHVPCSCAASVVSTETFTGPCTCQKGCATSTVVMTPTCNSVPKTTTY